MRRGPGRWFRQRRLQWRLQRSGLTWLSPSAVSRALGVGLVSLHEPLGGAQRQLERQIDDLHRAGALDAGSADVVDELVRTWADQEEAALVTRQIDRRVLGGQLVKAAEMRLHAASQRSAQALETFDELVVVRATAHERLTGAPAETTVMETSA